MSFLISDTVLQELSQRARSTARKRTTSFIHTSNDDPVLRLCNAVEPDTYLRPHRHPEPNRWELVMPIIGVIDMLFFRADGMLIDRIELSSAGPKYGIEIPSNTFHTLISKQAGTALLEIRPGPFIESTDKDFALWAPAENTPEVPLFLKWFYDAKVGDFPPKMALSCVA